MTDRPTFNGNNTALALTISTLLDLDKEGVVAPGRLSGLARQLLTASAERLNESVKREALFKKFMDFVESAPVDSGICCCGGSMSDHDYHGDHAPVDQWDVSLADFLKELKKAIGHA